MFDLSTLDIAQASEQITRSELEHPVTGNVMTDDDGKPYYIDHVGDDAPELRKYDRKISDERSERQRKGKSPNLDMETIEEQVATRLTLATRAWYLPPLNGETLEFNKKNAMTIYNTDGYSWIPDLVIRNMRDRKRFFPKPSKS